MAMSENQFSLYQAQTEVYFKVKQMRIVCFPDMGEKKKKSSIKAHCSNS